MEPVAEMQWGSTSKMNSCRSMTDQSLFLKYLPRLRTDEDLHWKEKSAFEETKNFQKAIPTVLGREKTHVIVATKHIWWYLLWGSLFFLLT